MSGHCTSPDMKISILKSAFWLKSRLDESRVVYQEMDGFAGLFLKDDITIIGGGGFAGVVGVGHDRYA